MKRHGVQLSRQSARLREQAQKLREQDTVIAEMKRHMQEWDLALSDLKAGRLISNDSDAMNSSESPSGLASSTDGSSNSSNLSSLDKISNNVNNVEVAAIVENEDSSSNASPSLKRNHNEVATGPADSDLMAIRAKRFCRILKFCENKSMKHTES